MIFVVGDVLNKYYFPVFIPVGITGNILSLMVSTLVCLDILRMAVTHADNTYLL